MPLHRAFLVALVVEMTLVGVAVAWLTLRPSPPPPKPVEPMRLQLVEAPPAPPKPEVQPPPPEPTPQPKPKPEPVKTVAPRPKPVVKPPPVAVQAVVPMAAPKDAPPAPPAVVAAPAPPAPPAPARANADITADFESRLRAAIQAVLRYPVAAKAMGREGRVRIGFDFLDGAVSNIRIVQSGDLEVFDHAAEEAVESAGYPPLPPELQHRPLHFSIWVEFHKHRYY